MIISSRLIVAAAILAALTSSSCQNGPRKSPDVTQSVRRVLDDAGLRTVSVGQDTEKGIVTLGGTVATEAEKQQAETLAKSVAAGQVVALDIAVVPVGGEKDAREINADVDKAIEYNLRAALTKNRLESLVKFEVSNSVVTLHGEVDSLKMRDAAEKTAAEVSNVRQVVNTLQVKKQKATSTQ